MARDVMILMGANPFQGPLDGVGPENREFLGPEMATSEHHSFNLCLNVVNILGTGINRVPSYICFLLLITIESKPNLSLKYVHHRQCNSLRYGSKYMYNFTPYRTVRNSNVGDARPRSWWMVLVLNVHIFRLVSRRVTVLLRRGWAAGECFRAVCRLNFWPRRSGSRRRCSSRSEKHTRLVHTVLSYFFRCCESGSGLFVFWPLNPWSRIQPIFLRAYKQFFGVNAVFLNSLLIESIIFLDLLKNE